MTSLMINNSFCRVDGVSIEQISALRNLLSIREIAFGYIRLTLKMVAKLVESAGRVFFLDYKEMKRLVVDRKFRPYKTKKDVLAALTRKEIAMAKGYYLTVRTLMAKSGQFPTGLLYLVEKYFHKKTIKRVDQRVRPPSLRRPEWPDLNLGSIAPYPEQWEAAVAVLKFGRGIVVAPTGVGKSLIAALICAAICVATLIVVPTLVLKKQTIASLQSLFGEDAVGPLVDGRRRHLITVENLDALDPRKAIPGVDMVIVDEWHHAGAPTYRALNRYAWAGVYYKIGLTATPFRSKDTERLLLESILSQVIYEIPYEVAVKKGYIVPLEAYYYDLPELETRAKTWGAVYNKFVCEREDRNRLIAHILTRLNEQGLSTLVLTKQISHGRAIQELAAEAGSAVAFVNGENDDNRIKILEFNLRERTSLIGTEGILGEGVDTKPAEYGVVAGLGKSKNAFMQKAGRLFRVYPGKTSGKLILFRDPSHRWTLEHFNAQVRYLREEYGIKPTKLELPEGFRNEESSLVDRGHAPLRRGRKTA